MRDLATLKKILVAIVVVGALSGDKGTEAKGVWIPRRRINIAGGYGYSGSSHMRSFMAMQEDPRSIYKKHHRRGGVFDEPLGKGPWTHDKPVRPSDNKSEEQSWEELFNQVQTTTTAKSSQAKSRKRPEVPAPIAGNLVDIGGESETTTAMPMAMMMATKTEPPTTPTGNNGRVYRKSCGMRCGLG